MTKAESWKKAYQEEAAYIAKVEDERDALWHELKRLRELAGELCTVLTEIAVEAGIYHGRPEFEKIETLAEDALVKAKSLGVGAK